MKILKDDYEKQIEILKQQHGVSVKRLNSEIDKLNGEKYSLVSELDAVKSHGNNNYNSTTSVTNNHHFGGANQTNFLNPTINRHNNSSSINADYTNTLSVGTLRSGTSQNNNDDFLQKLRSNCNELPLSNNYRSDELPISSRSEAFNQDVFKQPSAKKLNLLDNIENSPNTVSFSLL